MKYNPRNVAKILSTRICQPGVHTNTISLWSSLYFPTQHLTKNLNAWRVNLISALIHWEVISFCLILAYTWVSINPIGCQYLPVQSYPPNSYAKISERITFTQSSICVRDLSLKAALNKNNNKYAEMSLQICLSVTPMIGSIVIDMQTNLLHDFFTSSSQRVLKFYTTPSGCPFSCNHLCSWVLLKR